MEYEQFLKIVKSTGIHTVSTTKILYARHPNPPGKQLLVRWGTDELLAYIDIKTNSKGQLEDIYCKPLKDVTIQDIQKFADQFKKLHGIT